MKNMYLTILKIKLIWYNLKKVPKASLVLLINSKGEILSVSRKDNIFDKNIIGGKVDYSETFEQAAIRECKEETNLDIYNLIPIFIRKDGKFICVTYLADYSGNIKQNEKGAIQWIQYDELFKGSFGNYNRELKDIIKKYQLSEHISI